jgi:UDP-N-acetylmuramoylalanine--D-glutamate ligase
MENYIYLKSRLIRGLRESEFAVLNYDDEIVRSLASSTKAKVVWFSTKTKTNGAYLEDGKVMIEGQQVAECEKLGIKGTHNLYNVLAAATAAHLLCVENSIIAEAVCAFKGVRHRIEKVAEIGGVTYIDDSKATNIDATLKAVDTMTCPTILLLGGKNKGYDYGPLFEKLKNSRVIHTVLYGENRFQLMEAAVKAGFVALSLCGEFEPAVRLAAFIAKEGQTVLLSPASSSFDMFSGFEQRGDTFCQIVEKLQERCVRLHEKTEEA